MMSHDKARLSDFEVLQRLAEIEDEVADTDKLATSTRLELLAEAGIDVDRLLMQVEKLVRAQGTASAADERQMQGNPRAELLAKIKAASAARGGTPAGVYWKNFENTTREELESLLEDIEDLDG